MFHNNNPLLPFTHSNYFMSSLPVTDTLSLCKLIVTLKDNQVRWYLCTHLFIIDFFLYRFTYLNINCNYVHDKLQQLRFYHSYMACNKQYVMDFRPYKILVLTMVLYIKYITWNSFHYTFHLPATAWLFSESVTGITKGPFVF